MIRTGNASQGPNEWCRGGQEMGNIHNTLAGHVSAAEWHGNGTRRRFSGLRNARGVAEDAAQAGGAEFLRVRA